MRALGGRRGRSGCGACGTAGRCEGGVVTPECCIVAVAVPGLQAKEPAMPGQSAVLHGTPRDWVDMFVGVLGYQVVCPYLVRGQHSLPMPDDVPRGFFCLWGGGGAALHHTWHAHQSIPDGGVQYDPESIQQAGICRGGILWPGVPIWRAGSVSECQWWKQ